MGRGGGGGWGEEVWFFIPWGIIIEKAWGEVHRFWGEVSPAR